ncbi:MAG: STAS domain-containing protein [Bacteroidota bacterium]
MALEIKENRGIYEILGNVTAQNLGALRIYFENILETNKNIVINLENVSAIDSSSALFFESIYKEWAARNKVISIIGRQNKDISEIMYMTKTDYILSTDRI